MNLFITPHPPIILSQIGNGEEEKARATIEGMKKIADDIAETKPDTIAIITPHGNVFSDALCVNTLETLKGDFSKFRHGDIKFSFKNDKDKAHKICTELVANGISCLSLNNDTAKKYKISSDLDHGALVPLYFVAQKYTGFKLIHISIGFLSKTEMYEAGRIVSEILSQSDVIIVSGDLSHKLSDSGPYMYDKMGPVYDKYIVDALKNKHYIDILDIDENMLEHAGQCAQKPLEMMLGALEGYETQCEVYSYEGPYGVGYMTAKIVRGEKGAPSVLHEYMKRKTENYETMREHDNEYVALAYQTIHEYITKGIKIKPPKDLSREFYHSKSGVFVSIKKEGRLRGCIGTTSPTKENIALEIITNAISASTRDPRFNPIEAHELPELTISVDVLHPAEDIKSKNELNVKEYGVIVSNGFRRGLLLPNLEGVDTVDYQISVALEKAGISPDEDYKMQRFKVVRHK
jgi:AmmeMemoRadiSam system protein A